MYRIVVLEGASLVPQAVFPPPTFEHEWIVYDATTETQVEERLRGAQIAIVNKVPLRPDALARLPGLKLIAVSATGIDCVDVAACRKLGVAVCNVRGYSVDTVPEHVFALLLALKRSLLPYREDVLAGEWQKSRQFCFFGHPIADLAGGRLGIVGRGTLGRKVARLGEAFGMTPLFAGRKGDAAPPSPYVPWDSVLETSDVVSLHCPLTPQTRGMIGLAEFRKMGRRPVLINTARGGIVVEDDLERALDEGLVAGAGIDVTSPEPPPADSTVMRLARRPNVIVTPHVAWASGTAQQAIADLTMRNIEAFVAGRPINLVT